MTLCVGVTLLPVAALLATVMLLAFVARQGIVFRRMLPPIWSKLVVLRYDVRAP